MLWQFIHKSNSKIGSNGQQNFSKHFAFCLWFMVLNSQASPHSSSTTIVRSCKTYTSFTLPESSSLERVPPPFHCFVKGNFCASSLCDTTTSIRSTTNYSIFILHHYYLPLQLTLTTTANGLSLFREG